MERVEKNAEGVELHIKNQQSLSDKGLVLNGERLREGTGRIGLQF